ncbi:MAG TPA: peptidoglycan DD-metalloendopeptidase family protein [Anaerolineaceae bacterium]|nr:peptidoglycan DD-metalloendopeptidase family protein [Anaerolineaceae bacterium]
MKHKIFFSRVFLVIMIFVILAPSSLVRAAKTQTLSLKAQFIMAADAILDEMVQVKLESKTIDRLVIKESSALIEYSFAFTSPMFGFMEDKVNIYGYHNGNKFIAVFKEPSHDYYIYADYIDPELLPRERVEFWRYLYTTDIENAVSGSKATYYLPFQGGTKKYTYNTGNYHFDFSMPEGTQVYASRGGTAFVKRAATSCNCWAYRNDPEELRNCIQRCDNYVRVTHSDGTYGYYVHFLWGGITVNTGDTINTGTCLGLSGNTGFSQAPHLHFNVTESRYNYEPWVVISFIEGPVPNKGDSPFSQNATSCGGPQIPAAPSGVTASDGTYTDRVVVNWNAVSGTTRYEVYRATSSGGTKTLIGNPTATSYTDTSVTPGTTYWYWVKACNSAGCSGFSAGDSGFASIPVPAIPTNIQASDGTYSDRVQITWNAVQWAQNYLIYRSNSLDGTKTQIGTSSSTSYSDYSMTQGVTYYYWVRACNGTGCSNYSASDTGWASIPIPAVPSGLVATDGAYTDKVQVSWNEVAWATSYKVYRADSETGTKTEIGQSFNGIYDDNTAVPGTIYWYFVRACGVSGCSNYSLGDSGYALLTIPIIPTNVTATDGTYVDRVEINWSSSPWATSYQIYRADSEQGTKIQIGTTESLNFTDTTIIPETVYWYFI